MKKYFLFFFVVIACLFLVSCLNNSSDEDEFIYKIKYLINGSEVDLSPKIDKFTEVTVLPTYEEEGFLFVGWYLNEDFTGQVYSLIDLGITGDKIFYGKILKAYNLTLDFNGAVEIDYQTKFHEEENVLLPSNIEKPGFKFKGWYLNEDFSGEVLKEIALGTKNDLKLSAKFLKIHTLTLNLNGGEELEYENEFTEEDTLSLPLNVLKEGYTFAGWYLTSNYKGDKITEISLETKTDITLYAKFIPKTASLYLNFNGGIEFEYDNLIIYDEVLILPTEVSKENYLFVGWYLNEHYPDVKVELIPKYTTEDVVLYAHYDINENLFSHINLPEEGSLITNNLILEKSILAGLFDVYLESENEDIIDNKGRLKRPYNETELTLTIKITDYQKEIKKDYSYLIAGYKSLDAPIRSGYIYREYFTVNDYYFENQEILYTAFSLADSQGNFTDSKNITYFGNVNFNIMPKAKELGVRVIMSVGPSSAWIYFSKTPETRENFANNIVELINQHGFDGVDIDWETPRAGYKEDVYFLEMMKLVYQKVKENNPHHLVTTAITGGSSQGVNYNLANSKKYLDYINLMTYHMASNSGLYQSALYPRSTWHNLTFSVGRTPGTATISNTISIFTNAFTVPKEKLIVGIPFYGIKQVRTYNEITNAYSNWSYFGSLDYQEVLFELNKEGFSKVFDEISKVPYLINNLGTVFISFEDPESIKLKAEFVIEQGVAGMMYWEYHHEYENILLQAMVENLPKS